METNALELVDLRISGMFLNYTQQIIRMTEYFMLLNC